MQQQEDSTSDSDSDEFANNVRRGGYRRRQTQRLDDVAIVQQLRRLHQELDEKDGELGMLRTSVDQLTLSVEETTTELEYRTELLTNALASNAELTKQVNEAKQTLLTKEVHLGDARKKIKSLETEVKKESDAKWKMKVRLTELETSASSTTDKTMKLKRRKEKLEEESKAWQKKMNQALVSMEAMEKECSELRYQNETLSTKLAQAEDTLASRARENDLEMQKLEHRMTESIWAVEREQEKRDKERMDMQVEREEWMQQQTELQKEVEKLRDEMATKTNRLIDAELSEKLARRQLARFRVLSESDAVSQKSIMSPSSERSVSHAERKMEWQSPGLSTRSASSQKLIEQKHRAAKEKLDQCDFTIY